MDTLVGIIFCVAPAGLLNSFIANIWVITLRRGNVSFLKGVCD